MAEKDPLVLWQSLKEQRFCGLRRHKDRSGGQNSLEFVESFLSLDGPHKALGSL